MKPSPGCSQMLPGLILAKSLAKPRWSGSDGAYSGKIFCCAPLIRNPRGLFWQNLLLRPAGPRSPGLILAKSFVVPRRSEIPGAYSGKIFCCAPLVQDPRGLFWQNLLLRPASPRSPGLIPTKSLATPRWSEIPGAYSGKIFCCAPLIRDPRGLFWQNLLLRPADPKSLGLIPTKSLAKPH